MTSAEARAVDRWDAEQAIAYHAPAPPADRIERAQAAADQWVATMLNIGYELDDVYPDEETLRETTVLRWPGEHLSLSVDAPLRGEAA